MVKGFKEFVMRGNVVDLAVAVVFGTAFAALVNALVTDLLTPIIAAIFGKRDFSGLKFTVNDSQFLYGDFLNALITFLSVAAAVYFFVLVPLRALNERRRGGAQENGVRECPECLSDIPAKARRCAHCTAEVATA